MSKYTTQVRFICETFAGKEQSEGYDSEDDIIVASLDKVFDFPFPIFDENYRTVLEHKILRHYYTREIGFETVGLWKHFLRMRLNEIMPYYNKLYNSELLEFNPFYDVDLTTDHNKELNGQRNERGSFTENTNDTGSKSTRENIESDVSNSTSNTTTDAKKNDHWDLYQDTPQGGLEGVRQENYLTNVRHTTDDTTGSTQTSTGQTTGTEERERQGTENETRTGTRTGNNTKDNTLQDIEDYIQHVKGKSGGASYSKLLNEFRQTFLNIDVEIINNLSDLFFGLW